MNEHIAIINGPNINLTGIREVEFYGHESWDSIQSNVENLAKLHKVKISFFQSNSEADIVDYLQRRGPEIQGLVLNPAALSKTGFSILDAIGAFGIPYIEVHLSNVFAREQWHSESIFTSKAEGNITGLRGKGYELALLGILDILNKRY